MKTAFWFPLLVVLALSSIALKVSAQSSGPVFPRNNFHYDSIVYHYGLAESQLERINVRPLHAMGLDATGVRLGFLDTGFRWRINTAFQRLNVLSEFDYVFQDSITANQVPDDPSQDNHGTGTLSAAMGYVPDTLIGPAYNGSVYLAKTEDIRSEHNIEEENYANALQDMEAAGVDITTSSLGYFTFDSGQHSYTYPDMNGHTTIVARAAERAAQLGVLVVTAMGNGGQDTVYPYIDSPGDADSIISVGALNPDNSIAGFSSRGPTYDGRIKPEISAPGVSVWVQTVAGTYQQWNGTSLATPLVSGACCLIKQAHPEATAQQIRRAIMMTGDNAAHPDTAYGWGRVNAYAAALELGMILHRKSTWVDSEAHLCFGIASKNGIQQAFALYRTSQHSAPVVLPLSLTEDSLIYGASIALAPSETLYYQVVAFDGAGSTQRWPAGGFDSITMSGLILSAKLYPNPATDLANLEVNGSANWTIFDAAGRGILSGTIDQPATDYRIDLTPLPNGPYYIHLTSDGRGSVTLPIIVAR